MTRVLAVKKVLSENDRIAASLRERFRAAGTLCLNFIGSPGAGKTSLLERTLEALPRHARVAVLTGDIQTDRDARRLVRFGFPVQQITTGGACHLDARRVERAIEGWLPAQLDLLLIENVGNLVCPASYDLGEDAKIVVLSVAEGDDKPLKYPATLHRAALVLLNKLDLLPFVYFNLASFRREVGQIHPGLELIPLSCVTGDGLGRWQRWLERRLAARRAAPANALAR